MKLSLQMNTNPAVQEAYSNLENSLKTLSGIKYNSILNPEKIKSDIKLKLTNLQNTINAYRQNPTPQILQSVQSLFAPIELDLNTLKLHNDENYQTYVSMFEQLSNQLEPNRLKK
jgi:CHASE3 domain sensor protein